MTEEKAIKKIFSSSLTKDVGWRRIESPPSHRNSDKGLCLAIKIHRVDDRMGESLIEVF